MTKGQGRKVLGKEPEPKRRRTAKMMVADGRMEKSLLPQRPQSPNKNLLHHIHSKMRLRNRDTDNVETSDSVNVTSDVTGGHAKVGNGRARGLRGATKVSSSPSLGVRRLVKRGDILFLKFR
uniref:Uncharacterized protein n=1 Tax=Parascaris univalens TaxID=6257 RepID=A0A915A5G3_PARUN